MIKRIKAIPQEYELWIDEWISTHLNIMMIESMKSGRKAKVKDKW